jgi:hypothetical protein
LVVGFGSDESDGRPFHAVPAALVFLASLVPGLAVIFEHALVTSVAAFEGL